MIFPLVLLLHCVMCYKEYPGFDPNDPTRAECITKGGKTSYLYYGTRSTDVDGIPCSNWTAVSEKLMTTDMFVDNNYCRTFTTFKELGPWCYNEKGEAKRCFSYCDEAEAFCLSDQKRDGIGTTEKTMSFSGRTCVMWHTLPLAKHAELNQNDRRCKSNNDGAAITGSKETLKFAPYCYVQGGSGPYVEPCFASCEMTALKVLPNNYSHLVDKYAVGGRQTTWGDLECKPWKDVDPALFPLHAGTNFCACPSQYQAYCERAGLFCFTNSTIVEWQGCYTTEESEDIDAKGCIDEKNRKSKYLGFRNYTYEGDQCIAWEDGGGIPDAKLTMAMDHGVYGTSYCRNFFLEDEGPWCYVAIGEDVFQQPCFRTCEEHSKSDLLDAPCFSSSSGELSESTRTTRQRSNRNVACLKWSIVLKNGPEDNFCRVSPELDGMPGCYEATTHELRSCYVPCPGEGSDEFFFASEEPACVPERDRLTWYGGSKSVTMNDEPCEFWDVVSKAGLPNMKELLSLYRLGARRIEDAAAYCRNLDYDPRGPWCMTVHLKKEYCFPRCSDINVHCLNIRERQVIDYEGVVHHTLSGKTCPVKDGEQTYCRNVDFDPHGPSCDVGDGNKEPCFPLCSELEDVSVEYMPFDVAMKMARSIGGKAAKPIMHGLGKKVKLTRVRRAQRFAFWIFFFSLLILTLSCVGFPLLRYVPFIKAYLVGRLSSMPKDRGYRRIVKLFHEHGRNPPSFQDFNIRRQKLGPEGDPLLVLK